MVDKPSEGIEQMQEDTKEDQYLDVEEQVTSKDEINHHSVQSSTEGKNKLFAPTATIGKRLFYFSKTSGEFIVSNIDFKDTIRKNCKIRVPCTIACNIFETH